MEYQYLQYLEDRITAMSKEIENQQKVIANTQVLLKKYRERLNSRIDNLAAKVRSMDHGKINGNSADAGTSRELQ